MRLCSIPECGKKHYGKGLCRPHYSYKYNREYYSIRHDEIIEKQKQYYYDNRTHKIDYNKEYYQRRNPDYHLREHIRLKCKLCYMLHGEIKCQRCDVNNIRLLEFDHINGDGKEDRLRLTKSMNSFFAYYVKHSDEAKKNLQVLCRNCHKLKSTENGDWRKSRLNSQHPTLDSFVTV